MVLLGTRWVGRLSNIDLDEGHVPSAMDRTVGNGPLGVSRLYAMATAAAGGCSPIAPTAMGSLQVVCGIEL